ncbi:MULTISPECIES: cytochrome c oxidase subunit II [unclassified Afipia]|uniref:cytochrome c oxidase subunit II n=1 Tax=unclassified Afipia TaxID=2642050 RepID=UPI000462F83B|nr:MULTISPECIES: cytochrome c oxidase subunit II [unclassified Afipia]MAH68190.1 cytochrome c oxidase subunit II [Afipia sp.]OUX62689.1 MAG: cytochrome c oxidase subunit II [Afipia sp. TMED4]HCX17744.1 cytochrome c oxidase subunit II [Afipia sp.]
MTSRLHSPISAIVPACLLGGCSGWQSVLDASGTSAVHLKQLIVVICIVSVLVWLGVMSVLAWGLLHRRERSQNPLQKNNARERRMMRTVAAATVATAIIIVAFTLLSFYTTRTLSVAGSDDLVIRVRGLQWWWEVKYLNPAEGATFATANEIHIPVGRNVRVQLEGADVIHSFWVPSLAGKQDMIPGRLNDVTLHAERPGIYRGQCAEFCGLQHARMAFVVIAEPADAFAKWIKAQQQEAAQADDSEVKAGKAIFESRACAACHTVRGTSAAGTNGPDLTHIGTRKTIAAGVFETTRGSLAAWIADPQTIKPGNNMPMVPLQPDELRAVSAYMMSLK